jgi:hypothetical protein
MRSILCYAAGIVVVVISCVNVLHFNGYVSNLPPRHLDERFIWEQRLAGIRAVLSEAGYNKGDVGYMPAGVLQGHPRTDREVVDWIQVRYAMIPLNVVQDTLEAQFVVAEFSGDLEGFTKLYDARNGWALFRRNSQR